MEITFENDSDSDGPVETSGAAEMTKTYLNHCDLEKERLDETVRQRMEQLGMKTKDLNGCALSPLSLYTRSNPSRFQTSAGKTNAPDTVT